jgi:PAS domain S-box-containing protein
LRTIVDTIPALAWTARPDGSAEFFNRRWLEYTGLAAEQALDWAWTIAIHPDDRHRVVQTWRNALARGAPCEVEARMRRVDGEYRWFLIRANASKDASGQICQWYGTNTEIEDRHRADQAVRTSEQNLRLLVDSIPGMVATTNTSGELEFVNRQVLEYFGRPLGELQAWELTDAVHPDDLQRVIEQWREGLASEQPHTLEHRLRRADGTYHWFQYRNVPVRDIEGRLVRWYGLMVEIDDLRQAKDASRATEQSLRLLIDSVPGLVFTTKATGELEFVNRQLLDYFGKSVAALQTWAQDDSIHPDDLPNTIAAWGRAAERGQPVEFDHRMRRADGVYRWFTFRAAPLLADDGRVLRWYGLVTDIDDLKRAEDALRSMQASLARATHLATVSELSASIAHEVNQPLTAVVANAHACHRWLSAQPANVERALLSAERTARDGTAAAQVIQRIRLLFQRAPPAKAALSLNETIEEVCKLMADELRANQVALVLRLQRDLPQIAADRVQMQQVIFNLVRNGLEAAAEVIEPKQLSIDSQCEGSEVVVHIKDTGNGIRDPSIIFEPFHTTKAQGMGMGLAICRSIIEAHGGRLWASANSPQGAVFSFALQSLSRAEP